MSDEKQIVDNKAEIQAIFLDHAIYVNHLYAVPANDLVRLTFAEKTHDGDIKIPRFSMVVTHRTLLDFANMLTGIIRKIASDQEQAIQPLLPDREQIE